MRPIPHHLPHHRGLVSLQCIKYSCSIIDVIHLLVLFGYHLKPGTEYVKKKIYIYIQSNSSVSTDGGSVKSSEENKIILILPI